MLIRIHSINPQNATGSPHSTKPIHAVTALIEALQDGDTFVRRHAVEALGKIGPAVNAATPVLVQFLQDGDKFLREDAAIALGGIGPLAKDAVPALIQALKDNDEFVRTKAGAALMKIDPDAAPGAGVRQ